jgi:hypothetical protein
MIEEINRNKKFNNLCLVFNGLKKRGFSYGLYGYGNYGNDSGEGYYVSDEQQDRIKLFGKRLKKTFGIKG